MHTLVFVAKLHLPLPTSSRLSFRQHLVGTVYYVAWLLVVCILMTSCFALACNAGDGLCQGNLHGQRLGVEITYSDGRH
jgi:hypothetical protein